MHNRIAVIGIGYVGFPLLKALGTNDKNSVIGYDISKSRVGQVRHELVLAGKTNIVTTEIGDIQSANIYIITVPTPTDKNNKPDISCLIEACKTVASVINKGDLIIIESTVYPSMTEDVCIPIIESFSGLKSILDFRFGYSPERMNVGDLEHTITNTTKVVAGCDEVTTEKIAEIYESIPNLIVEKAKSIKVAEAAKLMENTQRDILITFANEYAEFCSKIGISIYDVIKAASTKWNFARVYPGLVGGHCIGVDSYYLLKKANDLGISLPLVTQARNINDNMASKVARRLIDEINITDKCDTKPVILILGFSYKKNCADIRNTKVADLVFELESRGCDVHIYDPLVDKNDVEYQYKVKMMTIDELVKIRYDAVLEAVHHDIFNDISLHTELRNCSIIYKIDQLL